MTDTLKEILRIYKEYTYHDTYCYNLHRDYSNKKDKSKRWLVIMTKLPKTTDKRKDKNGKEYLVDTAYTLRVVKIIDTRNPNICVSQITALKGIKYEVNEIIKKTKRPIIYFTTIKLAYYNKAIPKKFTGEWVKVEHGAIIKTKYVNGKKEGVETERCIVSNKKIAKRNYTNGELNGTEKRWYTNGQIKAVVNFNKGCIEGNITKWYENGNKCFERVWKGGYLNKQDTYWFENGTKKSEQYWKDPSREKYKINGYVINYYENGTKKSEYILKNGILSGPFISFYPNGAIKILGCCEKNEKIVVKLHENGEKQVYIKEVSKFDEYLLE